LTTHEQLVKQLLVLHRLMIPSLGRFVEYDPAMESRKYKKI